MLKSYRLGEIAQMLGGTLKGDPKVQIRGVNGILEATEGEITFLANPKYKDKLPLCKASAVFVGLDIEVEGINLVQLENPRLAFAKLVAAMLPPKKESGRVSEDAFVDPSAVLAEGVTLYPGAFVGEKVKIGKNSTLYPGVFVGDGVQIGEDCLIMANVTVNTGCKLGDRVVINPNSVVGSEGFGYERDGERHFKVPQAGYVVLEDDVEIGTHCAIDRGSIKATVIGKGTKLDNLIHVAHNCRLGENNLLLSQVGLAGTVKTGKNVYFAGQSGCLDHITLTDFVQIGAKAVVTSNIEEPGTYFGYPARPYNEWQKANVNFYKADEMRKKLNELEKRLSALEKKED